MLGPISRVPFPPRGGSTLSWSLSRRASLEGWSMRGWMSQIVIGIIVTVVGTVIADAIVSARGGRHFITGSHFSGLYSGPGRGAR